MSKQTFLYLVPDLIGPPSGIARYCQMVCRGLLGSGAQVAVLSLIDRPEASAAATVRFPGMAYQTSGGSRSCFIWLTLQQALRLRPQLIIIGHAHFAHVGWLAAHLCGARAVAFLYGVEVWQPLSFARRWALRHMDRLIAISRYTAQRAATINQLPADRLRVLYNCLDPQFEQPATARTMSRCSLLTVARISEAERYKGHDYVIRALPHILQRFPDLVYDVVGDGAGRPTLESLAQQVSVAHAVRFHGRVSDEELRQRYAEASIYIMPSAHEGFGFVFIEAMAYGVPAIGGNVDATPEVIKDGETGYCVNPTSMEEIAQAVTRLLSDEALRQRLGAQAARHVSEKFSFAQFQQQLLAYLREVAPI